MPSIKQPAIDVTGAPQSTDANGANLVAAARLAPAPAEVLPLRNRNIGVLCADLRRPDAILLQQAAAELGARTALVKCELEELSWQSELQHTARVLGRLYDAVLCIDMPSSVVQLLREAAGIPVVSHAADQWRAWPVDGASGIEEARQLLIAQLVGL